jgi:hypothetical protein
MRRSLTSSAGSRPALWAAFSRATQVDRGGEGDAVPGLSGLDRQPDGQVGLAGSGRPQEYDVGGLGQEGSGAEVGDHVPVECGLVIEVEVLQRLTGRETGRADAGRRAGGFAGGDLPGQYGRQILFVSPAGVAGLLGQSGGGVADARRLEGLGVVQHGLHRILGHDHATSPSEVTVPVLNSTPNARS